MQLCFENVPPHDPESTRIFSVFQATKRWPRVDEGAFRIEEITGQRSQPIDKQYYRFHTMYSFAKDGLPSGGEVNDYQFTIKAPIVEDRILTKEEVLETLKRDLVITTQTKVEPCTPNHGVPANTNSCVIV